VKSHCREKKSELQIMTWNLTSSSGRLSSVEQSLSRLYRSLASSASAHEEMQMKQLKEGIVLFG
jgi:hypothetical protein